MVRRVLLGILWISFVLYAVVLAPPEQPDTWDLIRRLSTGDFQGINPAIVTLFNAMGIWPMVYACVALVDGRFQKIRAWPFVVGAFGLGAFVLLPYLVLRQSASESSSAFTGTTGWLLKGLESRWLGWLLTIGAAVLIGYGVIMGDWVDFIAQWQTSRFINVMSLDFCLLTALFPLLVWDDLARRQPNPERWRWVMVLIPLVGAALYLALRPPLPEPTVESV